MITLVTGEDARVGAWMFQVGNAQPMQFNMAVGLSEDGGATLCGGFMYTNFNGSDVELHFYGPGLLKTRVFRAMFYIAAVVFNVNRMTIRTRKEHMARGVTKLGAVYEGTVRRLYGPSDGDNHAAKQFAFFRERINQIAGLERA